MEYKLFDDFISLQSLLKSLGLISSGGAVKAFLATETVLINGEREERRGRKLRLNDHLQIPKQDIDITLVSPSAEEIEKHREEIAEKERVARLVKQMNQNIKKKHKPSVKESKSSTKKMPIRYPGF